MAARRVGQLFWLPINTIGDMQRELRADLRRRCVNVLDGTRNRCFGSVLGGDAARRGAQAGRAADDAEIVVPQVPRDDGGGQPLPGAPSRHQARLPRRQPRGAQSRRATERKEQRRNDPELHAHDQQVAAEYRANNVESIAEYNAAVPRRAPGGAQRVQRRVLPRAQGAARRVRNAERRADPMKHAHDLEVAADRREERRNDPELHAHDQQVAAEYRADNAGHIAEVSAEYRAEQRRRSARTYIADVRTKSTSRQSAKSARPRTATPTARTSTRRPTVARSAATTRSSTRTTSRCGRVPRRQCRAALLRYVGHVPRRAPGGAQRVHGRVEQVRCGQGVARQRTS